MNKIIISVFLLMLIPAISFAENSIKPGLWEITTKSDLLAAIPRLSPEQMQQIAVLAEQHGLEIPQIDNGATTSKVCITKEMANQEIPSYFYENQSGCVIENSTRNENKYKVDLVCENPQFSGKGTAEGVFSSSENFTAKTSFDSDAQGKAMNITTESSGRWISDDCAGIDS